MKKVAILGTGGVGQALAVGFVKNGYEVVIGTHHIGKVIDWKDESMKETKVVSFEDAAGEGELVIIAVKGTAAEDVVKIIAPSLTGKTVIDTTNPIADLPPQDGVLQYFTTFDKSLMELLQEAAPEGRFVKAWNSVGNAYMVNPDFGGTRPSMFICGNNEDAKKEVGGILEKFGWEVEDMGGVAAARAIEPLCILWCIPGMLKNDWGPRAFKLLK